MIKKIKGNIFTTKLQTIVNTVNCTGIMGAGIALECKMRYPEMFIRYQELCEKQLLSPGKLYLYEASPKWILNFPTKNHWKMPSKPEYLESGLEKFCSVYREKGITSVAFPLLGTQHGGMDKELVNEMMDQYLSNLDIEIEIYDFDPKAEDDLLPKFRETLLSLPTEILRKETKLNSSKIEKLKEILVDPYFVSMIQLFDEKGLGEATITACYQYAMNSDSTDVQLKLF